VNFILFGKDGSFASNARIDWMQQNRTTLGSRPLSQLCILGTHDSGMWSVSHCDVPGGLINDYVLTQSVPVFTQLSYGARYLDIRPVISSGKFWTGHYSGKIGANGESLDNIISGVNQFTAQYKELVILNFSHTLQTDADGDWPSFSKSDWQSLMKTLTALNNRYMVQDPEKAKNLNLLTLNDFIGNGQGAVICVMEDQDLDLGDYATKGFYKPSQLGVRNEYSNKDDAVAMVNDQLAKMKNHMSVHDNRLNLLSWTLTQQIPTWQVDVPSSILNALASVHTIKSLAYSCNKELFTRLLTEVSSSAFPNVVYIDYLESSDYLALIMAINDKVLNQAT
jgi:hypothetical protein